MSIPVIEQETGINRLRTESEWWISTSDRTIVTKLRRGGWEPNEVSPDGTHRYTLPKGVLTFRSRRSVETKRPGNPGSLKTSGTSSKTEVKTNDPAQDAPSVAE